MIVKRPLSVRYPMYKYKVTFHFNFAANIPHYWIKCYEKEPRIELSAYLCKIKRTLICQQIQ